MKVFLRYWCDNKWTLTTENKGLGVQVYYACKPTSKQIRRQKKAISKLPDDAFSMWYSVKTGKFELLKS